MVDVISRVFLADHLIKAAIIGEDVTLGLPGFRAGRVGSVVPGHLGSQLAPTN